MVFANTKESRPLKSRNFFRPLRTSLTQGTEMTHAVIAEPFRVSLSDFKVIAMKRLSVHELLDRIVHLRRSQGCSTLSTDAPLQKGIKALQSRGVSVLTEGTSLVST